MNFNIKAYLATGYNVFSGNMNYVLMVFGT